MSNGAWENRKLQSAAVLWLRYSFARAFSGDSMPVDCRACPMGLLAMTRGNIGGATSVALIMSLREALASWQSTVCKARIMEILCPLIASAIASQ